MSSWADTGNAKLGEIIAYLRTLPRHQVVKLGFCNPHSYRGYYEDLAFEPAANVTVDSMLADALSAVGLVFHGYKGGEYTMTEQTDCWLADYGCCGVPIMLPTAPKCYLLPLPEKQPA